MPLSVRFRPVLLILLSCLLMPVWPAHALEKVNLQLKFLHQFQFAGYYAALEKGYYRDAGLEVQISEGVSGNEPLQNVLSGTSQYAVGSSSLLLARHAGKPVVVLAVVFQHSPYVLLAPRTGPTQAIHDIIGKRVMLAAQSEELVAYLKKEGIALDKLSLVPHSFDPDDLISGKVYGFSAYATNETDYLDRAGFAYQAYTPRSAGIDFYGDNLFTSEQEIRAHPARARAFREASLRGWNYAMNHQEEIADLIVSKYSQRNKREHLLYEARQMVPLLQPVLVEMGYMSAGRWRHISDIYADLGMLPRNATLDGFLYDPDPRPDLAWLLRGLAAFAFLMLAGVLIHLRRLARERAQTQRQIRDSEERLQFAMDGAGYGVWDWNIKTGEVLYSKRWKEMHGFDDGDVPNQLDGWETRVHPDDVDRIRQTVRDYFDGKTEHFVSEHRARSKDGSWKWVLDRGMIAARDAKGRPLRMICTHADISERKESEEKLKMLNEGLESRVEERTRELSHAMEQIVESQKLASLGGMVAGISHELNTPIGNILMVASTLRDRLEELDQVVQAGNVSRSVMLTTIKDCRKAGGLIMRGANRSVELIESFKRVAVDQTSQRRRAFDLLGTVQDILNAMGPVIRRANASVELDVPAGIEMNSFPGHLEQILNNLIMNSITHGFDGREYGRIFISAMTLGDAVQLVYQDNGAGIARELQHRVFEPFYTTKLGQGGSGLGLSIVHNMTQAIFKGRLRLESEPEQGVRFVFTLPLETPAEAAAPAA
ncbi:MAG: ABC transporter substrate-binding protein [Pseudomonadota bacterium]